MSEELLEAAFGSAVDLSADGPSASLASAVVVALLAFLRLPEPEVRGGGLVVIVGPLELVGLLEGGGDCDWGFACELLSLLDGALARERKKTPLFCTGDETGPSEGEVADETIDETGMPTLFIVMEIFLKLIWWWEPPRGPARPAASC